MTNISTPLITSTPKTNNRRSANGPSRLTLERIRQVARAYTALSTSIPMSGLILN